MPTYAFQNNKTGERFESFMSISDRDIFLKENPDIVTIINSTPGFVPSTVGILTKAGDGWKDVQNKIKEGLPKRYADKIKTK